MYHSQWHRPAKMTTTKAAKDFWSNIHRSFFTSHLCRLRTSVLQIKRTERSKSVYITQWCHAARASVRSVKSLSLENRMKVEHIPTDRQHKEMKTLTILDKSPPSSLTLKLWVKPCLCRHNGNSLLVSCLLGHEFHRDLYCSSLTYMSFWISKFVSNVIVLNWYFPYASHFQKHLKWIKTSTFNVTEHKLGILVLVELMIMIHLWNALVFN